MKMNAMERGVMGRVVCLENSSLIDLNSADDIF